MMDVQKYEKIEAIEEMLDDNDIIIAGLDADVALKSLRIQFAESKIKTRKSANEKLFGYLRISKFKDAIHFTELKKLAYRHHQDGLNEKLHNLKTGKK